MDIKELIFIALDALYSNKLRTFLTALGIIIGTASVIVMLGIGNGSKSSVESRITSLGANIISITPGSSSTGLVNSGMGSSTTLVYKDYESLKDYLTSEEISGITSEQSKSYQLIYRDNNTNTRVVGVEDNYLAIRSYTLKAGSFFSNIQNINEARVIVLGSTTASTLFDTDDPLNKQIQIGNQLYTVIGVLNSKGSSGMQSQDDIAMVPINTSRYILNGSKSMSSIVIQVKDQNKMELLQAKIKVKMLELHNVTTDTIDFSISNSQDTLETLSSVSNTFSILLAGIASISLIVGGIGIMNTMIISITERTKEIGLRKAIGAKDRLVLFQFIVESVVLSTIGAGLGIFFGCLISIILTSLAIVTAPISIDSIILSAVTSMVIGLVFGIYPARKAAKLSPIEALRHE